MKQLSISLAILLYSILWTSCANQIALTGGPRDESPPQLDTLKSFANEQTHFKKQPIKLFFDEYIQVSDAARQVVVSPPLSQSPTLSSRLKRVEFAFHEDEQLKENTTYVINFGSAIRDFTEGNKLENFTRVFSTGDRIDSLQIKGKVIDAISQEPAPDCLVMLYIDSRDSIIYQEKPYYFAKTDQQGSFTIKNLRADTFKVLALTDKNLNYLFENKSEQIGFLEEDVILNADDTISLALSIFKEKTTPTLLDYQVNHRGWVTFEFDQSPFIDSIRCIDLSNETVIFTTGEENKVDAWYDQLDQNKLTFTINGDTTSIRIAKNTLGPDTIITLSKPRESGSIHPANPILLKADRPISRISPERFTVIDTSQHDTFDVTMHVDTLSRQIMFYPRQSAWPEGFNLQILAYPRSTIDIWDYTNDTSTFLFNIARLTDFSTINLEIDSVPDQAHYIIHLIDNNKIIETRSMINTDTILSFAPLRPSSYSVRIVEDTNANGQWDSGRYLKKRQPERIYPDIELDELKENWILDKKINANTLMLDDQ